MEKRVRELVDKMHLAISANNKEANPLKRASQNIAVVGQIITEFIGAADLFLEKSNYESSAQIQYNKQWAPLFYSQLLFFHKCYYLASSTSFSTCEKKRTFFEEELKSVQDFFMTHYQFCQYYYSESTNDDEHLFTGVNPRTYLVRNLDVSVIPQAACPASKLVSCVLANEEYGKMLSMELGDSTEPLLAATNELNVSINGTETDVVELVRALHAVKFVQIDGKAPTLEFLIDGARKIFQIPLENWQQLASNGRARKTGEVKFLQRLADALLERNDKLLLRNAQRK
jgi:RteC protein